MATKEPITLVEIDIPRCSLTYGTAPCTASVGVTGDIKCFNTLRTCQDRANFARESYTLRFSKPAPDLPYDALPNIEGEPSITPAKLDPGRSMGVRASVKVSFSDHPTSDALLDKYVSERGYDPYTRGTFWAKFRARVPSMEGYPLRILRGFIGDDLGDMYTEHYIVTSAVMDSSGVTIQAKDALSFTDAKKAQCPVPSTGRLGEDVLDLLASGTYTLSPPGVGDAEYPASGYVCLSNKEVVGFTRSGDDITLTSRGDFGSTKQTHAEGAAAQLVKVYDGERCSDIVYSLLVEFSPGVEASWCDLAAWNVEDEANIGHLYSTAITAPTSVATLINELLHQAGAFIWWDQAAQQVRFRTLRPVTGAVTFDDDKIVERSLATKEQPEKRLSNVLTYFGLADYTNKLDKEDNFRSSVLTVDPDADFDYDGLPAFGKNLSRWINIDNRAAAERLNNMLLSRYRDAPRLIPFTLWADTQQLPQLGDACYLQPRSIQDVTGAPAAVPVIVIGMDRKEDAVVYDAEELRFADGLTPGTDRAVFIEVDRFNVNLRDLYDTLYSSIPYGATITFYVSPGAYVGSTVQGQPAMTVGDWDDADAVSLFLVIGTEASSDAGVIGYGGNGGGYPGASAGEDGGAALYTRFPIQVTNLGVIGGGGGGGEPYIQIGGPDDGQAGGGGGAGFNGYAGGGARRGGLGGNGRAHGVNGTLFVGGPPVSDNGHFAGDGGNLGADGEFNDSGGVGYTDAGVAIDGVSFITFTDADDGDVRGDQIN